MEVILLERIAKLGQMGETVKVRDGYARNYLLPTGRALRANAANKARFEAERAVLEARNLERRLDVLRRRTRRAGELHEAGLDLGEDLLGALHLVERDERLVVLGLKLRKCFFH